MRAILEVFITTITVIKLLHIVDTEYLLDLNGDKMSNFKKYYSAVEAKETLSLFVRRLFDFKVYIEDIGDEEFIKRINNLEQECKELFKKAVEIADKERPEERIVINPDRGIDDFLEGCGGGCDCEEDCGGGCGGCGGKP